jgi:hypothetical protein
MHCVIYQYQILLKFLYRFRRKPVLTNGHNLWIKYSLYALRKKHTKPVPCTCLRTRQIPKTPLELSQRVFQSDRKVFTFVGYDVTRGTSGSSDNDYESVCLQKCDIV